MSLSREVEGQIEAGGGEDAQRKAGRGCGEEMASDIVKLEIRLKNREEVSLWRKQI